MLRGPAYRPQSMDTILDIGPQSKQPKRRFFLNKNCIIVVVLIVIFIIAYNATTFSSFQASNSQPNAERFLYQSNYLKYNISSTEYEFLIVSDMDKKSLGESGKEWVGKLKYGKLTRGLMGEYTVEWGEEVTLKTAYNEAGRGMELSELVYFDGKLLTCDDRTGLIFEILRDEKLVVPLYVLTNGNGRTDKGFKCEWMTVVNDKLFVGSIGKEFTNGETIVHFGAQWIKVIDRNGHIQNVNWRENYEALRKISGTEYPAYIVHEAIMWNPIKREWTILPRRFSKDPYDESTDEQRGTNVLFFSK